MKWTDSGGGDFEQAPVGTEAARCIRIIDLGTQTSEYQGKPTHKRQTLVGWELPNSLMTTGDGAGRPFVVSKFYTASLGEKANLRKDLVNWRGREFTQEELDGFDPKNILNKPCMLSLTATDKGKTKVSGVMALPKGMVVPDQINPSVFFSLDDFVQDVFDKLSNGIKAIIENSPEYKAIKGAVSAVKPHEKSIDDALDELDNDIPF